ncbi:MAG: NADP-dependent malic enzyme [Bacteroidota bacterium]
MAQKDYNKLALKLHKELRGKLEVKSKGKLRTVTEWSTMYTPGVGAVSKHVAENPQDARTYTGKGHTVAVVSDGSAVLGLGNIGPLGALPVMEGKCAIFKELAGVDAWPLVLDTQDEDEIVETVKRIAPGFGGINLEDIGAPKCFAIEERLKQELDIPVFHDDQHGTAIVVLAGLINAYKVTKRSWKDSWIVIQGAGAAGVAIARLIHQFAPDTHILILDSKGVIARTRTDLAPYKQQLIDEGIIFAEEGGDLHKAITEADVVIGVSGPQTITTAHIERMNPNPIVFALANPVPEIHPDEAKAGGAAVIATGRSDFPNQVNNSLVFPGIFRGALDRGVRAITDETKIAAAKRVAAMVKKPTAAKIIPSVNAVGLVKKVAGAVK